MKEIVERRRQKRFQVQAGAFAAFKPHRLHFAILGEIMDIGTDGLAFRYIASRKRSYRPFELNILLADGSFSLNKIRCRIISDFEMENEFSLDSVPIRRRGVQFEELTPNQISLLEYLIQNYTIGGAST